MHTLTRRALGALAPALLLGAAPLTAQAPTTPVPVTRSVTFDVAAIAKNRVRAAVEGITLGRFAIGVGVGYQHRGDSAAYGWPWPYAARNLDDSYACYASFSGPDMCVYPYYPAPTRYRAWSLDLAIRYYPSFLSFQNGGTKLGVYVGEFVGYHWRTWREDTWYYGAVDGPYMLRADTVIPPYPDTLINPPYYPPWPNSVRRTLEGLQPGAEIGVRLLPLGPLFVEVGGRFTLVTKDDPWRRLRPGDVESRLVVALGLTR